MGGGQLQRSQRQGCAFWLSGPASAFLKKNRRGDISGRIHIPSCVAFSAALLHEYEEGWARAFRSLALNKPRKKIFV